MSPSHATSDSGYGRGIWVRGNSLHFNVVEVLRDSGFEVTPESIEHTTRALLAAAADLGLPARVTSDAVPDEEIDARLAALGDDTTARRLRERDRPDLRNKVFAPTHRAIYHLHGDLRLKVVIDEEFPGAPEGAVAVRESGGATYFAERSLLSDLEVIW